MLNDEQAKVLYLQIGERVKSAREAAHLTQSELGERIALTRASVTNIEKARQSVQIHTLYAIAHELEVPVFALLPEDRTLDTPASVDARLQRALAHAPQLGTEEKQFLKQVLTPSLELISTEFISPSPDEPKDNS